MIYSLFSLAKIDICFSPRMKKYLYKKNVQTEMIKIPVSSAPNP